MKRGTVSELEKGWLWRVSACLKIAARWARELGESQITIKDQVCFLKQESSSASPTGFSAWKGVFHYRGFLSTVHCMTS